jgi:ABC-type transport system involved in cytochrome c biogenesis ATPase subunit
VTVENFRSLESVRLDLDPVTALVGANGSGKSSILRALDLVLGRRWPTVNAISFPHDFTAGEEERCLRIAVRLQSPLVHRDVLDKDHEIHGLQVRCKPYARRSGRHEPGDPNFDYEPLANDGQPPQGVALGRHNKQPVFGPLMKVTAEMREATEAVFVDHRRSLREHQPRSRGSVLARLLSPARKELAQIPFDDERSRAEEFSIRYQAAMDVLRTDRVQEIESTIAKTARQALGFLGSDALADLDVRFAFLDPANPFETLQLNYWEHGLELPVDQLGAGVQSAIVVGIFEAFRQLGTSAGTVLIEEPEMYLHPQAQRYLYRLLCDLADNGQAQVIYSTHSPVFADLRRFESLRLIRREPGHTTSTAAVTDCADRTFLAQQRHRHKLHTFTAGRSEMLFARRALLVEGVADVTAASIVAAATGLDPDAEDLSIIECGSKSAIPFVATICRALSIPFVVLHDEDLHPVPEDPDEAAVVAGENVDAAKLNAEIARVAQDGLGYFMLQPSLEGTLGISANAKDKPRRVAEELEARDAVAWPAALVAAVQCLAVGESA